MTFGCSSPAMAGAPRVSAAVRVRAPASRWRNMACISLSRIASRYRLVPRPEYAVPDGTCQAGVDSHIWPVIGVINNQRVIDGDATAPRHPFQDARRPDAAGSLRAAVPRWRPDGRRPDGSGRGLAAGGLEAPRHPQTGRTGARPPRRPADALQRAARRSGPADRLDQPDGRLLAKPVRPPRRSAQKDGPMSEHATATLAVVIEREMPYPPEKVWRALTQPHLIEEWLMKSDFQLVRDHRFKFTADWGAVDCQVVELEPNRTLSYTWGAYGLESVVTWTLTPTRMGTNLRMEQSGFHPDQRQAYAGAKAGWPRFLA